MTEGTTEVFAILSVFGMPVLIVLIVMLFTSKQKRDMYRMVETMVKNGQPVPEYVFKPSSTPRRDSTPMQLLRNGLINIAAGIGVAIALIMLNWTRAAGIASIPALVGVAYVIMYYVARGKEKDQENNDIAA